MVCCSLLSSSASLLRFRFLLPHRPLLRVSSLHLVSSMANRLASEHSPYLLQHAHNPVDWFPWGEEAFDAARKRDVPIFLSIGYSTCHWCHVMEVESFEDEGVAKMLNDWFVSIKVDREERPDVDKVYMTYVQALYGGGGWPLSVFLSPNLKPLMGGTYFPPDDKYGRPGFKTILRKVKDAWNTNKEMLEKGGDLAIEQLSEALASTSSSRKLSDSLQGSTSQLCAEQVLSDCQNYLLYMERLVYYHLLNLERHNRMKLAERYDEEYGGFGSAPKFPRPVELYLMLYQSKKMVGIGKTSQASKILQMVCHSLQCMSRGGMHDHIGGGFHRYSVDECWHVPHFEKMLYDQGQLANAYLDTFAYTKDVFYASMARDILDYLRREMIGGDGEIYSAEDADSAEHENSLRKKEGAFYVWTSKEVEDVLSESAELFKDHYYIKASGNCDLSKRSDPHNEFEGKNVLIERKHMDSLALKRGMSIDVYLTILGKCRQELFNIRSRRPRPHLDDKVIVSWNGLAISAFVRASKILKSELKGTKFYFPVAGCDPRDYLSVAENAVTFIKRQLYDEHTCRLRHSYRNGPSKAPGFLDDYAFLISALLDLYEFGGGTRWLSWAIKLQNTQNELFLDTAGGGYFNTPGEDPSVLLRVKEDHDGAEPSGNSVAVLNLVRLSSMFMGNKSDYYRETAEHLLAVFESRLKNQSLAIPLMCCAADMLSYPSRKQVVIVGSKMSAEFDAMVCAAHKSYEPNKTVIQIDPSISEELEFWDVSNPSISQMAKTTPTEKPVVAYVCQNFMCLSPVTDPQSLCKVLHETP